MQENRAVAYSRVCCGWACECPWPWVYQPSCDRDVRRRWQRRVATGTKKMRAAPHRLSVMFADADLSFCSCPPPITFLVVRITLSRSDTKQNLPALLRCPLPTSYSVSYNRFPRLIFSFWTGRILRFCRIAPKRRFFFPLKAFLRYQWHCVFLRSLITGHRNARSDITNRIGFFKSYNSFFKSYNSLIITLLFMMSNGKPFINFLQWKKKTAWMNKTLGW